MKLISLVLLALVAQFTWAQTPEIYNSIPFYPPKTKTQQLTKGPAPGSTVGEKAPRNTEFKMIENHPPKLELMVRARCGAKITRDMLLRMVREGKAGKDRMITHGHVSGDDVQIWIVATTRVWQRTLSLKSDGNKYRVSGNNIRDEVDWHITRLKEPQNGNACLDEEKLTRRKLWTMAQAGLLRIQRDHRLPES